MFISSIKEINRLLSTGMLNKSLQCEKVTYSKLRFSKFYEFLDFLLQLKNLEKKLKKKGLEKKLKKKGLEKNLCVAFLLFLFWKDLWRFKVKEPMFFAEEKYEL